MFGELLRILKPDLDEEIDAIVLENTKKVTQSVTKNVSEDMTKKTVLRMLQKKYDYEEIAEIAGTSVEVVKQIEQSEMSLASSGVNR